MDELTQRRYKKQQHKIWEELVKATAALKDAEVHLLKVNIDMEDTKWASDKSTRVREWALMCEVASEGALEYLQLLGQLLGYSDPFSSEPG